MADHRPTMLSNSMIVVAHPDDELLWFGSILKQVDQVVVVFEDFWPDPSIGPARAEALGATLAAARPWRNRRRLIKTLIFTNVVGELKHSSTTPRYLVWHATIWSDISKFAVQ